MLKKILHTGVAVPDLQKAIEFYEALGLSVNRKFHKPDIDADVAELVKGDTAYEIFQFNDLNHPWVAYIRNHVAVYSDDLENDVNQPIEKSYKIVIPINEGVIYRFVFLQDSAGMSYEIATDKREPA